MYPLSTQNGGGAAVPRLSPEQSQVVGRYLLSTFFAGVATAAVVGTASVFTVGVAYALFFRKSRKTRRR